MSVTLFHLSEDLVIELFFFAVKLQINDLVCIYLLMQKGQKVRNNAVKNCIRYFVQTLVRQCNI